MYGSILSELTHGTGTVSMHAQPQIQEAEDAKVAGDLDRAGSVSLPTEGPPGTQVVVRIRPPLPRELYGFRSYQCTTHVDASSRQITISESLQSVLSGSTAVTDGLLHSTYRFTFDHVHDQYSTQQELYESSAKQVVLSSLEGYNAAIIAYGQTGTGKTFTMEGESEGPLRGIIPRTVEDIFRTIENDPDSSSKYLVRTSYLQIYNEVISDLLKPERTGLTIREDRRRGVYVEGLSEWVVRSPQEVHQLMRQGSEQRATGATKMNEVSSRSHAVCIIIVEKCTTTSEAVPQALTGIFKRGAHSAAVETVHQVKVGKLNLVDLAGSERVHITGATGKRLEESKKINASLSALGNVIAALTDKRERSHIPYRDSKLTRILEDSLGGNCRTSMLCCVSPALEAFAESLSTLKFANRAKNIKNEVHVNEDLDQRTLLRKYEKELRRLRGELQRRNRELVDKRHLLAVEEQKKRAEADKLAALTALEARSREFLKEKEEKRHLEAKISAMQSQLLQGGNKPEDTPALRALLVHEQRRIRSEYEERIKQLESERSGVDEGRAQADRYRQLLLKQRDIMIALTARLNERDEQILSLQEELEAFERHERKLEDSLDQKTAELIALRRVAVQQAADGKQLNQNELQSALGDWGRDNASSNGNRESGSDGAERQQSMEVSQLWLNTSSRQEDAENDSESSTTQLLAQLKELEAENRQLKAMLPGVGHITDNSAEVTALRDQCDSYAKERAALTTILDTKVQALVAELHRSIGELPDEARQHPRLPRQLAALDKLVQATINAMAAAQTTDSAPVGL